MSEFPNKYRPYFAAVPTNAVNTFQLLFFFPNMCHICHCLDSETITLKRCSGCGMISYCGKEHQTAHWNIHKDFCREIGNLLKISRTKTLFNFMKVTNDPNQLLVHKLNLMDELRRRMKRDLHEFEVQMILFPRMCAVCYETSPDLLRNCGFCPQVSYCLNHVFNMAQHKADCHFFRLCYASHFYNLSDKEFKLLPDVKQVAFQEDNFKMPENMSMFLKKCISGYSSTSADLTKFDSCSLVYGEFFSQTLTVMHALDQINYKIGSKLTIHIIDLPVLQEYGFLNMEVLLHLISRLKNLDVVLISRDLFEGIENRCSKVYVCSKCVSKRKKFTMKGFIMTYQDFIKSDSFETPDIVVSYDLGNFEARLESESLPAMKNVPAPFLVTNRSFSRALAYNKKITDTFDYLTNRNYIQKNSFGSFWPSRDEMNCDLLFPNQFFTVYTLHNIEKDDKSKNQQPSTKCDENSASKSAKVDNVPDSSQSSEILVEEKTEEKEEEKREKTEEKEEKKEKTEENMETKNDNTEKLGKKKKKKNKKKKAGETSSSVKNELSENADDVTLIPNESEMKNENSETEKVDELADEILELTIHFSESTISDYEITLETNVEEASTSANEKKKKKKKKSKKKKSEQNNATEAQAVQSTSESTHTLHTPDAQPEKSVDTRVATKLEEKENAENQEISLKNAESADKYSDIKVVHLSCLMDKNKIPESQNCGASNICDNEPSCSRENQPSTSTNEASNFDQNEPSRSSQNEPSSSSQNEPSCSHQNVPSCSSQNEPSCSSENKPSTSKGNDPQEAGKKFGELKLGKTTEELLQENRNLNIEVERLAEEYRITKATYRAIGTSMRQEVECLKLSLETIEEKLLNMFPGDISK